MSSKRLRRSFKRVRRLAKDLWAVRIEDKRPVLFFDRVPNVGDLITPYLVRKIERREPYRVEGGDVEALLGVGSLLHWANTNSRIWGTGAISPAHLPAVSALKNLKVTALRGHSTLDLLTDHSARVSKDIALGDPALLVPRFFRPYVRKTTKIGIVPHYVDYERASDLAKPFDIRVIDVKQRPEKFIRELLSCESIFSSSLHGLILADAYNVPNLWVKFSDGIIGGNFKYRDYYSTTMGGEQEPFEVADGNDLKSFIGAMDRLCSVKSYRYDTRRLLNTYPF